MCEGHLASGQADPGDVRCARPGRCPGEIRKLSTWSFFFFQAEDGIRDKLVTGVQTCALPICNIKAENHAKLMTAATFLAREKMVDIEDDLYEKGFSEFEKEQNGTFDDKGFSRDRKSVV